MNRELITAYGIKINTKSKGPTEHTADVEIRKSTKDRIRLTISFREDIAKKFNESIIITYPIGSKIYFFKGSDAADPAEVRTLSQRENKGTRYFMYFSDNDEAYKDFYGSYTLHYWNEIGGWYISNTEKEEKECEK